MQDRFKFKVKIQNDNTIKIFDVECIDFANQQIFFRREDGKLYNIGLGVNGTELIECTGLKDKNGKLVYEGDIVRIFNTKANFEEIRLVIFKDCAFQFNLPNSMVIDKPLYCWAINYLNHYKHIEIEIIGTIYEHPELLEVDIANI